MKTVRCNLETFGKMLKIKHELELEKFEAVNMSDVQDVLLYRYEMLLEKADPEVVEEVLGVKFAFTDKAEVVAVPISESEAEDDDEEDEDEAPVPKKRKTTKAAAAKRRRRSE